jgi:putative endonuclease
MFRAYLARWFAPKSPDEPSLGQRGEDFAARYLKRQGYKILGRQVDLRVGELDIIAVDMHAPKGRTIVFIEVKTRSDDSTGTPAEAVDELRQKRMTHAAVAYLKSHRLLDHPARFDVIALTWPNAAKKPTLDHIQNAFDATGQGQFFN